MLQFNSVTIDICLATYNGELYLREQLDSIINQSHSDWHLYVRDDGSIDRTVSIINEYKDDYSNRITIIQDNKGNLGFAQNFFEIMSHTKSDWVVFSDQDDIWHKSKLALLYERTKVVSKGIVPYIVFHNFNYIDSNGEAISQDYYNTSDGLATRKIINGSDSAIFAASMPGCVMMINRCLCDKFVTIPIGFDSGHDHFLLYSLKILKGKFIYVDEVLIDRRIHNSNAGGVKKRSYLERLKRLLNKDTVPLSIYQNRLRVVIAHLDVKFSRAIAKDVIFFLSIENKSLFKRIAFILRSDLMIIHSKSTRLLIYKIIFS